MTTPRGIRNHNPGNIRYVEGITSTYAGCTGSDGAFCIFDTPEHGIAALGKLLKIYQDKHGLTTVRGIINRWAPPVENDTGAYVSIVAQQMGVGHDEHIDLHDASTLVNLATAIIRHENGQQPYSAAQIVAALGGAAPMETPAVGPVVIEETEARPEIAEREPEKPMGAMFLPAILQMIPQLLGVFGKGEKGERNAKAAQTVVDAFTAAVPGAVNTQQALEMASASPAVKAAAVAAVLANPVVENLLEVSATGIKDARAANLALVAAADTWWKVILNPVLIVTAMTLPLIYIIVIELVKFMSKVSSDVIAQTIGTVIGLVLGGVMGFWMGQTYQESRKRITDEPRQ